MKPHLGSRLDQIIISGALALSIAVLVNLTDFPNLDGLSVRRSLSLGNLDVSSVAAEASAVVNSVGHSAETAVAEASAAASTAVSHVSSELEELTDELKSHLPDYYSVGLWNYCKGQNGTVTNCSDPSINFSFDLLSIFDSVSTEVNDLLPGLNQTVLAGYRDVSQGIIWLYIFGFISTILVVILGVRKAIFSGGNKLLAIFATLSMVLITTATIGVTVIYGLWTAGIKSALQSFGASASLGGHTFAAT
ncbi:actin cortical patch SUR7/pH-response regulator pali, partial [Penicillium lividum]